MPSSHHKRAEFFTQRNPPNHFHDRSLRPRCWTLPIPSGILGEKEPHTFVTLMHFLMLLLLLLMAGQSRTEFMQSLALNDDGRIDTARRDVRPCCEWPRKEFTVRKIKTPKTRNENETTDRRRRRRRRRMTTTTDRWTNGYKQAVA